MSGRHGSIDRFEEEFAVVVVDDGGGQVLLPRDQLPEGAREGDVLDLETLALVPEAREALEERVRRARRDTPEEPGSGNFDL